jgi:hypothetical protein
LGTRCDPHHFGADMSKRARKRRSRKGNAANHGRKPNA